MAILSVQRRGGTFITRASRRLGQSSRAGCAKPGSGALGVRLSIVLAIWLVPVSSIWAQGFGPLSLSGASISGPSGGYTNTSQLYGNTVASPQFGAVGQPEQVTNCPWILPSLTKAGYTAANGWNVTFATAAQDRLVAPDLKVTLYEPWVVSQPTFTDPNGKVWGGRLSGQAGGADLQLSFTPTATDPLKGQTVQWIQAVDSSYRGGAFNIHLDAPRTATSPFYNTFSAAGPGYFADIPGALRDGYNGNPIANVQFQVFLAVDNGAGGGFTHNVTLYAGEWWGYQYTATAIPTPEPSTLLVWSSLGAMGLIANKWRKRKRAA